MIRRIDICGGPCAGKTGVAAKIFSDLKSENYSVELSREYVKGWAYLNRHPKPFDQFYLLGKQLQIEYVPLEIGGVNHIINDSPLFLVYCYATLSFPRRVAEYIRPVVDYFDEEYPPLTLFLNRGPNYDEEGRFHTEEEARHIDNQIKECLIDTGRSFIDVFLGDNITEIVKRHL